MESKLILGSAQFGLKYGINNHDQQPDQQQLNQLLDLAWKEEVRYIDTARDYGNALDKILAYPKLSQFELIYKFKKTDSDTIRKEIEQVCRQIQKPLYCIMFHSFKDAYDQQLADLVYELRDKKLINKIGVSVYYPEEIEKAAEIPMIEVIQTPFNLLDNINNRGKSLEIAKKKNIEIHARSVFLQGLFYMSLQKIPAFLEPLKPYLQLISNYVSDQRITMEQLAIGYVSNQKMIDKLILGVDNKTQLASNAESVMDDFPVSHMEFINSIKVVDRKMLYPTNWN